MENEKMMPNLKYIHGSEFKKTKQKKETRKNVE